MTSDLTHYAKIINEAWNSHDIEKVISFYAPDYIGEDVGQASPLRGRDALRTVLRKYWRAFPDLKFKVISTLVEGSRIAILWIGEGTHQGTIMNIPPTGHWVEVRGVSIIEVTDGLVVRGQYIWDLAGMLRHMGLLPELQSMERV
jgi:steroid delta-isomerase-like uncharacterized protein